MHFIRALWENKLQSEDFVIKNDSLRPLLHDEIVTQTETPVKQLKYLELLFIYYPSDRRTSSILLKNRVQFEKNGYFDPFPISWDGEMAKLRTGDLLPYEYSLGGSSN